MSLKTQDGSKDYILATGAIGAKRLELQNQIQKADTLEHLQKASLKAGQVIWDIGCGNGTMTEYFAEKMGKNGEVVAVDISQAHLDLAKERVKAPGFKNITFICGDITMLEDLPIGKADVVYMRYILMHQKYPERVIKVVKDLLKGDGVVASQESVLSEGFNLYKKGILKDYVETLIALGKHRGADFNIGDRLKELYEKAGFKFVEYYSKKQTLPIEAAKSLMTMSILEWKDKAIEAGLTTQEKVNLWLKTIDGLMGDDELFCSPKQGYALAWK